MSDYFDDIRKRRAEDLRPVRKSDNAYTWGFVHGMAFITIVHCILLLFIL